MLPGQHLDDEARSSLPWKPSLGPSATAGLHVLLLLSGLCFPVVVCWTLASRTAVSYWAGPWGRLGPLLVFWVLLGPAILGKVGRTALRMMTLGPILLLLFISRHYWSTAVAVGAVLGIDDCVSFPEKVRLEDAWQAAATALELCVDSRVRSTGTSGDEAKVVREELQQVLSLDNCALYLQEYPRWRSEWTYLQSLEERQHCSGWCDVSGPLWTRSGQIPARDRCSQAAAYELRSVAFMSKQAFWYCLVLLGIFSAGFSVSNFSTDV